MRGLRLKGENYEGSYVIADVKMDHDYPTIRRALFDPECRRGGTVLVHKQPDDIWRIDYQLREGEDPDEAVAEATVRGSVQAVLDDLGHAGAWELEWWSIYSANTLALDSYRDGRVFFVGDSAHIVPIFGVRGLNNGLADAQNIAWKLARVLDGRAQEPLLDSYSPERRGATLDVFANASKSARFMTPPTASWQLMRDAALSLALTHPFAGELANPRQMTPYTYCESPIVEGDDAGFDGGPVPGAALPEMRVGESYLSDLLGPGFTVLTCNAALAEAIAQDGLRTVSTRRSRQQRRPFILGMKPRILFDPTFTLPPAGSTQLPCKSWRPWRETPETLHDTDRDPTRL
jgi:3-(3-hydroxy-phenyl)propionate hydroxylase